MVKRPLYILQRKLGNCYPNPQVRGVICRQSQWDINILLSCKLGKGVPAVWDGSWGDLRCLSLSSTQRVLASTI